LRAAFGEDAHLRDARGLHHRLGPGVGSFGTIRVDTLVMQPTRIASKVPAIAAHGPGATLASG
jgi:hypothetical protein